MTNEEIIIEGNLTEGKDINVDFEENTGMEIKVDVHEVVDYNSAINKPSINGNELVGDKTTEELGIDFDTSNFATKDEIPTVPSKVSAFENDSGYLTEHQDISGKADKGELPINSKTNTPLKSITADTTKVVIDGVNYTTYSVYQRAVTDDKEYPIVTKGVANTTSGSSTVNFCSDVMLNPSKGSIKCKELRVNDEMVATKTDMSNCQEKLSSGNGIRITESGENYSVLGSVNIGGDKIASGFLSQTNYLNQIPHGITTSSTDFEMVTAFSISRSVSGSLLMIPYGPSETAASLGLRVYQGKLSAVCGSTSRAINASATLPLDTKVYGKLALKDGTYTLYGSTNGVSWTPEGTLAYAALPSTLATQATVGATANAYVSVYLRDTYTAVNGGEALMVSSVAGVSLENPTIISPSVPTTSTVGNIGQIYVDTETGTAYMCVGVSGSTYTWKQMTLDGISEALDAINGEVV